MPSSIPIRTAKSDLDRPCRPLADTGSYPAGGRKTGAGQPLTLDSTCSRRRGGGLVVSQGSRCIVSRFRQFHILEHAQGLLDCIPRNVASDEDDAGSVIVAWPRV